VRAAGLGIGREVEAGGQAGRRAGIRAGGHTGGQAGKQAGKHNWKGHTPWRSSQSIRGMDAAAIHARAAHAQQAARTEPCAHAVGLYVATDVVDYVSVEWSMSHLCRHLCRMVLSDLLRYQHQAVYFSIRALKIQFRRDSTTPPTMVSGLFNIPNPQKKSQKKTAPSDPCLNQPRRQSPAACPQRPYSSTALTSLNTSLNLESKEWAWSFSLAREAVEPSLLAWRGPPWRGRRHLHQAVCLPTLHSQ
jgi:hypothetical protein